MSSIISEMKPLKDTEFTVYQQKWESRSSVRSRPEKYIDFNLDGYFLGIARRWDKIKYKNAFSRMKTC